MSHAPVHPAPARHPTQHADTPHVGARARCLRLCFGLFAALTLGACAGTADKPASPTRMLWQGEDGFVALAPVDSTKAPANDQPVEITPATLRDALTGLRARVRGGGVLSLGKSREHAVFSARDAERLARPVARGLAKAGPREDVIFTVNRFRGGSFTDAIGETTAVSGRLFHREGRLNVILGQLFVNLEEQAGRDSSSNPKAGAYPGPESDKWRHVRVGGRAHGRADGWTLLPVSGITLARIEDETRSDWAVIAPGAPSRKAQPENEERTAQPEEAPDPQPRAEDSERDKALKARLRELRELRDEGLIPEDLYRDKAREILDAL